MYMGLGKAPATRVQAWDFMRDNWEAIFKQFGSGQFLLARMIKMCCSGFVDETRADEVEAFFAKNTVPSAGRTVQQVIEKIRANAAHLARDREGVAAFLAGF